MKKLPLKHKKEAKRFVEYFISGGVWFWSGYILIVLLDGPLIDQYGDKTGLFIANFIGNAVGITLNFILERYWVFKSSRPAKLFVATRKYIIYTALNAFLLNYAILYYLKELFGLDPAIGQFIASAFFIGWNYAWYKAWVFKDIAMNPKHKKTKPKMVRHHA